MGFTACYFYSVTSAHCLREYKLHFFPCWSLDSYYWLTCVYIDLKGHSFSWNTNSILSNSVSSSPLRSSFLPSLPVCLPFISFYLHFCPFLPLSSSLHQSCCCPAPFSPPTSRLCDSCLDSLSLCHCLKNQKCQGSVIWVEKAVFVSDRKKTCTCTSVWMRSRVSLEKSMWTQVYLAWVTLVSFHGNHKHDAPFFQVFQNFLKCVIRF